MVAPLHYNDDILHRLLFDQLDDEDDVASHVETCAACQQKLETLSQSGMSWEEVATLLKPDQAATQESDLPGAPLTRSVPFLQPSDHPESLGRFARYEIMELLGRGGMGIVMRGYDPSLNRHSAIKVLAPELASGAAARRRFSREAQSAAAVVHPHVVPIQTVDEQDGLPYLVMPVVEGYSVEERVRRQGPLELVEVVRVAAQVAEGLAAAHEQGLVHRDIKPANVLLENGVERVMITDFGLARAVDDASMTRSGVISGTPQYMSPEQAHGDEIDHRSDLFSLGSLIYYLCTGRSPFRAETTMGVLNRIANDQPRNLQSINADVPEWLEQTVTRLLAKDPNERFQTAAEVAELLHRWLAHLQTPESVAPPCPAPNHSSRRPPITKKLTAFGAGGVLLVLAIVFVLETTKGTITIENKGETDIPIVIRKSDKTVEQLTVNADGTDIRVRAGQYTIELADGATDMKVVDGTVTISWGDEKVVKIVRNTAKTEQADSWKTNLRPEFAQTLARKEKVIEELQRSIEIWRIKKTVATEDPSEASLQRKKLAEYWIKRQSDDLAIERRELEYMKKVFQKRSSNVLVPESDRPFESEQSTLSLRIRLEGPTGMVLEQPARIFAESGYAPVSLPCPDSPQIQPLDFSHAALPVGRQQAAASLFRFRLRQQFANRLWRTLFDRFVDLVLREPKTWTDGGIRILRIHRMPKLPDKNRPFEEVEVGHLAIRKTTEPGRVAYRGPGQRLDMLIQNRLTDRRAQCAASGTIGTPIRFRFPHERLIHDLSPAARPFQETAHRRCGLLFR